MRQQIVFFLMLLGFALQAQKTTVQGDILKAKQEFWIQAKKITEISEDSSFTAASALRLVTQRAIKVYTDNRIGGRAYNAATTPTTGQVIKWNGTTWEPSDDAGGPTGTPAALKLTYWNAGGTELTTGGIRKDASSIILEDGLNFKINSAGAGNLTLSASATEAAIQSFGSVPLKINPLGNAVYFPGLIGGANKALSVAADGLAGILDLSNAGGDLTGPFNNLQIAAGAVGTTELADNSVSANKIGTGQVTMPKIEQAGATTGQAIAWNGTAWAPTTISGGGGGTITGSGTSGILTKWTGITAIGNSIIQDNGVNVGVGKSPSFKLDVNGVINAVSHRFSGYSSQITEEAGRMLYYVNGSRLDFIDITGSKFMGRFSDSELALWNSNGSKQLSFGINTIGTGIGYYNGSFRIAQRLMVANSGTASARVHVIGEGQTSGTYTALFRNSNNDELFNIRDDKAVSVGTASPSSVAKFHVELDAVKTHMIVNYLGNTILSVRNDANVSFGSNAGSFAITTGTNSSAYNGQYFRFSAPSTSATLDNGGLGQVFVLGRSSSSTSGNTTYFSITSDNAFNPTSGNRSMTGFRVHPSINQTGTASGIIYGIDYDPGVTSILGAHYGLLIRSGFSGFNTATPTATLDVNGTARFRSYTTDGNVFTHDASGNLTDITPAALVAAGGGGTNISNSNLTSTGSYALNLVNNSLTFDASTSTNTISQPIIIKAKADGVNSSQPITFQDASSATLGYLYQNNLGVTLGGTTGKSITLASGTFGWTFHPNGVFLNTLHTSDPTTTGLSGGQWVNSTSNRLKFRTSAGVKTVATLEDDLAGTLTTYAIDATPGGASYGTRVDAFSAPRTVTLGASLTEGRVYVIKGVRNNTNTITVNADSGYTLEIDGDASIGPTTFNMNAGEVFTAQRFGTQVIINR